MLRIETRAITKAEANAKAKGVAEEAARGEAKLKAQKLDTAEKMISKGYDIEEIVELTCLSTAEITKLKMAKHK